MSRRYHEIAPMLRPVPVSREVERIRALVDALPKYPTHCWSCGVAVNRLHPRCVNPSCGHEARVPRERCQCRQCVPDRVTYNA